MLSSISSKTFETIGVGMSCVAWFAIGSQCAAEWANSATSTLTLPALVSWAVIFTYWSIYGLRFRRPAIVIGNGVAALLQVVLIVTWAL